MCMFGSTPDPPEPTKPPAMPTEASASVSQSAEEERKHRLRAKGVGNSILTSPLGVTGQANTTSKSLLGQ